MDKKTMNDQKMMNDQEMEEDKKPENLTVAGGTTSAIVPAHTEIKANDFMYYDSDSVPRLHTDSSCSEQVVSPEFTCEVQSEPKYWEKALNFPFNCMDTTIDGGFGSQFQSSNQMSPLQDIFMYLQKPF